MQNKHETYLPRETSWEDLGRIEKTPEAMGGLATARWSRQPHPSTGRCPPLGFWPPLLEASSTASPDASRPLVKSVRSYGARASHWTINTWVDPLENILNPSFIKASSHQASRTFKFIKSLLVHSSS